MPLAITSTLKRFAHILREFTVAQRTIAIIGLAVIGVGAVGLTAWLSTPSYSPLFTSLSGTDASSITQLLKTDNVPYQLSDGGATILVPQGEVDQERLKAASAGLPSLSQSGYGLLDKMGVTASEFQQTTTYKRALEGELATTIEAMNGVTTASVKLAIPEQTVFDSQKVNATASVFVRTSGGSTLSSGQVQAITHLTAASVDGLTPANVSVISADGTLLSGAGASTDASGGSKATSSYEAHVQSSVQAMLDRVVGAGNSTVVVAADLSADSAKQTSQTYSIPTNAPALNEQSSSEVYNGSKGGTGATGVLGPDNIAVPSGTSTDGSYTSLSSTKNNAVNTTTETKVIPAGALSRQTVSVAINKDAVHGVTAASIRSLVDAAAGVDPTRGDLVDVQMVAFSKTGAAAAAQALAAQSGQETQKSILGIATTAVIVLGVLVGLFFLLRFVTAATRRGESTPIDLGSLDSSLLLPDGPGQREVGSAGLDFLEAPPRPPALPTGEMPAELEIDRMRANIDRLAGSSPQRTAEFLRNLMDEKQTT